MSTSVVQKVSAMSNLHTDPVLIDNAIANGKTLEEIDAIFMKRPPHFEALNLEPGNVTNNLNGSAAKKSNTTHDETGFDSKTA